MESQTSFSWVETSWAETEVKRIRRKPPSVYSIKKYTRVLAKMTEREAREYLVWLSRYWSSLVVALKEHVETNHHELQNLLSRF